MRGLPSEVGYYSASMRKGEMLQILGDVCKRLLASDHEREKAELLRILCCQFLQIDIGMRTIEKGLESLKLFYA